MPSFEVGLGSQLLRAIRSRRQKRADNHASETTSTLAPAKLRQATLSDFPEVMALKQRWGLIWDSAADWDRMWRQNPALRYMKSEPVPGWVLEAEGRIVGYLGNISRLYRYGSEMLMAVAGTSMVIEPAYRTGAVSLIAAFYRQKSVDLYLTTTAIEAVGKLTRAFKASVLPQADYDSVLVWVLRPDRFAELIVKTLDVKPSLSPATRVLASLAIWTDKLVRRRWPPKRSASIKEISAKAIGDDFDQLWLQKMAEGPRLLAVRDAETLRWHFDVADSSPSVLCAYEGNELAGYVMVRHEPPSSSTGLQRSIIADIMAKKDDPRVLTALWIAAYEESKRVGSHTFEVWGFPPAIRQIGLQWHPYVRKYPACPFYYKAADPARHEMLKNGDVWYASPYDGDTTVWSFGAAAQKKSAQESASAAERLELLEARVNPPA